MTSDLFPLTMSQWMQVIQSSHSADILEFKWSLDGRVQGHSQPHSHRARWTSVPLSFIFFPKLTHFPSNISHFCPQFIPSGGWIAHQGKPWLYHHWWGATAACIGGLCKPVPGLSTHSPTNVSLDGGTPVYRTTTSPPWPKT